MGYSLILEQASLKAKIPQLKVQQAHSIKKAFNLLFVQNIGFDMVIMDISMPSYFEKDLFSGEDLGRLLIEQNPQAKMLVITSLADKLRLDGILNTLKPHGFLIKSEVDENHLVRAIQHILMNQSYYSPTIAKLGQEESNEGAFLDEDEKKFLHLMSKGIRNKEMSQYLPWSLSKVEKRKRVLHKKLGIEKGNTIALVNKAKNLGII